MLLVPVVSTVRFVSREGSCTSTGGWSELSESALAVLWSGLLV